MRHLYKCQVAQLMAKIQFSKIMEKKSSGIQSHLISRIIFDIKIVISKYVNVFRRQPRTVVIKCSAIFSINIRTFKIDKTFPLDPVLQCIRSILTLHVLSKISCLSVKEKIRNMRVEDHVLRY